MKPSFSYFIFLYFAFVSSGSCQKAIDSNTGTLKITFHNTVNGEPMVLDGPTYTNPFGESYNITKFKYYISNVSLGSPGNTAIEKDSYHLVDQNVPGSLSFSFETAENTFSDLRFLIGVDSVRNVSGAQAGALDPLNDMFWTWNSGYVMAKMEGTSSSSNQARNIIEYHIGGFSGINNALKDIFLAIPSDQPLVIKPGQTSEITIEVDFNKWWQTPNDIKIANMPVCTTPGILAKKVADNYSKMFTIMKVANN
ncbi:MAG: MbnP family protein [Ferruginibacter sp.]